MTLKKRIAIYLSVFFSLLFGLISIIVYIQFSSFRREEAKDRLEEKAINAMKLLIEVKEVDKQLQKLIDSNTINKLYNEKTLIFDSQFELIYSSVDDALIQWSKKDLLNLKSEKQFFKSSGQYDFFGMYYDMQNQDYYAMVLAEDKYGNWKLQYLGYLLIVTFLAGTGIVWLASNFFIRSLVAPLDAFQKKITNITENNLTLRLEESPQKDEINLMAKAFNQMMLRIEDSYNRQKEFTSNASHELRTPLSRIISQLENLTSIPGHSKETLTYLRNIAADAGQMGDLVHSLLLLSKIEDHESHNKLDVKRIDELIFESIAIVKVTYPELMVTFSIIESNLIDESLEISCNESLLKIAFTNLLINACQYSDNQKVIIELEQLTNNELLLKMCNNGNVLSDEEQGNLFQAFMRGRNAKKRPGTGLGLRITQRILFYHKATLTYNNKDALNTFEAVFRL